MAWVLVVKPGLQTTVQDLGRWGHQASGVPVAGAMDVGAHRTSNALVGNPPSAATLEITLVGPELTCSRDCVLGVSGARFDITVDGKAIVAGPYLIQSESNRMGYRLRGPKLTLREAAAKISDATPIGLIQVPPSGEPVLLMADRPTTGGYPAIANVITADLDLAAQLAPGDAVRFAPCSVDDALDAVFERERYFDELQQASSRG